MIIIVDIGNTQTKWAVGTSPADIAVRMTTRTARRAASAAAVLGAFPQQGMPTTIVIGSVVPAATPGVQAVVRTAWPRVRVLTPGYREFKRRMPIDVLPRIEPGVDRLANALALRTLGAVPACTVDIGTAVTIEVVDQRGAFVGGAILPGVALQYRALARGTARVGLAQGGRLEEWKVGRMGDTEQTLYIRHWAGKPAAVPARTGGPQMPGQTTADAVAFGIERGLQWTILGLLRDVECALGEPLRRVVVTGGGGLARPYSVCGVQYAVAGNRQLHSEISGSGSSSRIPQRRQPAPPLPPHGGTAQTPQGDESAAAQFLCAQGLPAETDELLTLRGLMIMAAVGST